MSESLASYAVTEQTSRSRQTPEPPHPWRGPFERDRDRIIHSSTFRRLEGKTQVFTTGLNDHYRTRMTHSIEVAQIGRTLARALRVNEPLTEAVCLAHDLGHPPFGHTGEQILNDLMAAYGGFEHNRQALRIVDYIECPYPDFRGLNLMFETRLGLAKHTSPYDRPQSQASWPAHPSLEGQIADIADRIAYNCHDLEDGLRAHLFDERQLAELTLYQETCRTIQIDAIHDYVIRRTRIAKTITDILASDALETSLANLAAAGIGRTEQIYEYPHTLIGISGSTSAALCQLEVFLMRNMYLHPTIRETAENVQGWLRALFADLCRHPDKMPHYYRQMIGDQGLQRTVCDYIAGMTDRYCLQLVNAIEP
ncbi:MAG: dNTP triphosphohydrolase [Planctomycetales bacterium]|nr:dNTP triphosphohydrolase [Planctomycetales bacterium]